MLHSCQAENQRSDCLSCVLCHASHARIRYINCVCVTCAARSGFWLRQFRRLLTYGPDSRLSISPGLAVISSSSDCMPEETGTQIQDEEKQGEVLTIVN